MKKKKINYYLAISEAISKLLYPFAEVVLHDVEQDQIVAIFNSFSKREAGDSSYLDKLDFNTENTLSKIIGPYEKINYDGRKLKSITVAIHNETKITVGFLCINLDISVFDTYKNILNTFLSNHNNETNKKTNKLFKNDLYEQINLFSQKYCINNNLSLENLTREQKQALILKLKEEGALSGKNASNYIARILNLSRATIYNYLK
jgi:predicted transcriptional regulator YheO